MSSLSEEKLDFSDTEDEDALSSEDATARKKPKAPRSKRRKRSRFVETEAEVGDEEDEDLEEEEYDDELTRQFIADEDELATKLSGDEQELYESNVERYRALAQRQEAEELDVKAEEERLKSLYGKAYRKPRFDKQTRIPSQFLLPTPSDPRLWLVRCKVGKERAAVHQLLRVVVDSQNSEKSYNTFSAISVDNLKGYIYVESHKPSIIAELIERAHITHWLFAGGVTGNKIVMVPLAEMPDVLRFSQSTKVSTGDIVLPNLGDFVRVKRGKYAQDLAQVVEVPEEFDADNLGSVQVRIKIMPRLDYQSEAASRSKQVQGERPPARLFDQHDAAKFGSVTKSRGFWIFAGETYKDGYLFKDVRLSSLITDSVTPLAGELLKLGIEERPEDNRMDTSGAAQPSKLFFPGERVIIRHGDLKNLIGFIESVEFKKDGSIENDSMANITLESDKISRTVSAKLAHLERLFKLGDSVKVISGESIGSRGMIVDIDKKSITIYTSSDAQLTVPKSGIQLESTGAAGPTATLVSATPSFRASAKFAIFDLVQIGTSTADFGVVVHVLDNQEAVKIFDSTGNLRTESIYNIKKIANVKRTEDEIREGSRVVDASGETKLIVASHNGVAFLRKLGGGESLSVGQLSQLSQPHVESAYRPAAPRYSSGGYSLVGKSITIAGGQYKGYVGIVKELIDNIARVELHTNSKIVSVSRDRLVLVDGSSSTPSGGLPGRPAMTPAIAAGKTPAWSGAATGKTPAWGVATGKTPAWSVATGKTPAWTSTTPSWNPKSAISGKTPAWAAKDQPQSTSLPTSVSAPWALSNAEVVLGNEKYKIVSIDGHTASLSNQASSRSAKISDLAPVLPAKKDRAAIHNQTPVLFGSVIGLDGPDAVVKIDGTGEFKIVNINSLVKMV